MVVHAKKSNTCESETGLPQVQGWSGPHGDYTRKEKYLDIQKLEDPTLMLHPWDLKSHTSHATREGPMEFKWRVGLVGRVGSILSHCGVTETLDQFCGYLPRTWGFCLNSVMHGTRTVMIRNNVHLPLLWNSTTSLGIATQDMKDLYSCTDFLYKPFFNSTLKLL